MLVDLAPFAATAADVLNTASLPDLSAIKFDLKTLLTVAFSLLVGWALWNFLAGPFKRFALEAITKNWRLGLLGATGLVLSLASGWTTWDGMRNFTKEPVLSLMITFGIQGVMLIVAWLIGESFATGMTHRPVRRVRDNGEGKRPAAVLGVNPGVAGNVLGTAIGVVVFAIFAVLVLQTFGAEETGLVTANTLSGISNTLLFAGALLLLLAVIIFGAGEAIWSDYAQASRIMIRSAVLWVMFLACMGTSVFFSFDSLFSTIFPAQERKRAADLRAQNQVAGIVNDVGAVAVRRRNSESIALFKSDAWLSYGGTEQDRTTVGKTGLGASQLERVIRVAEIAPEKIRQQIASEIEKQRQRVAELQEKRASAKSGQAGLEAKKVRLTEELSRVQAERPETAAKVGEHKAIVSAIEKRLDEQRAVVLAEERGVEGSGKAGRGPMWRAARAELAKITAELEVAKKRLKGHQDRLFALDRRISEIKAELAQIDGDLARLKGESQAAEQLIKVARSDTGAANPVQVDPSAGIAALQKSVLIFRQTPTRENLSKVQTRCQSLKNAALRVESLRAEAAGIDCDPGFVTEAAASVFALNVGIKALNANCIGGDKLPQTGGADALFAFARGCVQDSGLPSDATDKLRRDINLIELNRDDKAHRFVVTVNAFTDGNKLAYLALAIAIAIDSLVFMSGLFGANAVRSPLSDVPSHKGRSAQQLETIVENALLPDTFENATMALEQVQPIARDPHFDEQHGWTHEVILPPPHTPERTRVQKVLSAGGTIGAVTRDAHRDDRFLVRGEFVEYLSIVAKKAFESDQDKVRLAELKKILVVALQPYVGDHAEIVLGYLKPISGRDGWSCEVCLNEDVEDVSDRFIVQKAINAGTTLDFVQKDDRKGEEDRFYMHRDFYRTLATIAAEFPKTGARALHPQIAREMGGMIGTPRDGGILHETSEQLTTHVGHERQITDQTGRPRHGADDYPAPPQPAAPIDFRGTFREQFIAALLSSDADYYWAVENAGLATAANRNLDLVVQIDPRLGPLVAEANRNSDDAISRVYNTLAPQFDEQPEVADQLKDVRREIEALVPLMMLAPRGRYHRVVTRAIAELENAAGHNEGLRPDEEDMLVRLRQHVQDIEGRNSAAGAIRSLEQFVAVSREVADSDGKVTKFPTQRTANDD